MTRAYFNGETCSSFFQTFVPIWTEIQNVAKYAHALCTNCPLISDHMVIFFVGFNLHDS